MYQPGISLVCVIEGSTKLAHGLMLMTFYIQWSICACKPSLQMIHAGRSLSSR
jgi:hypothetical protein